MTFEQRDEAARIVMFTVSLAHFSSWGCTVEHLTVLAAPTEENWNRTCLMMLLNRG